MSRAGRVVLVTAAFLFAAATVQAQDGTLQTMRNDVRQGSPSGPPEASPPPEDHPQHHDDSTGQSSSSDDAGGTLGILLAGLVGAGAAVSSPIWIPLGLTADQPFSQSGEFPAFPYASTSGYLIDEPTGVPTRNWAGRFDVEYVDTFDRVEKVGGHLLLETTSRFGLDTRAQHLNEKLAGGGRDSLWLGDFNLTYRFAQCSWAQFRAGLGFNWLDDAKDTDLGFNFLYGVDLFPAKPWVISATLDAGTLGRAGLFRFQTTAGVMLRRFELYTGYEYTDIERTHWNGLIGGVRIWF